ncbi:MAG: hypothetical protein ACE366_15505 [Bradymonadia bacterium]
MITQTRFFWPLALIAALALNTGCAVKSDTILADQDSGTSFQEGSNRGVPTADTITAYDGCDVDLTCSADCAEDLDCAPGVAEADAGVETLAPEGPDPLVDEQMVTVAPNESHWWSGTLSGTVVVGAQDADGVITLAAYDDAGALLARSTDQAAMVLDLEAETQVLVRAASPGGEVAFVLRVIPAE